MNTTEAHSVDRMDFTGLVTQWNLQIIDTLGTDSRPL